MSLRVQRRELALAVTAAMRAELAPVLVRLDGIMAALEAHVQYPAALVDLGAPEADRTVLLRQLRDTLGSVTDSLVKVVEQPVRAAPLRVARRAPEPPVETPAEIPAVPVPAPIKPAAAVAPAPVESPPPTRSSEELMREWFAEQLRRDRLSDSEIERRMEAALTKNLFAAANARRRKQGLPLFEVPA